MKLNLFFIFFTSLLLFFSITIKADIGWSGGGYYFIDGYMNAFCLEFDIFNYYSYDINEPDHFGLLICSKFIWSFWQYPLSYDTVTEAIDKINIIYSLFFGYSFSTVLFREVYNISAGVEFKYFSKDIFISKNSCCYLCGGLSLKMQNAWSSISIDFYIKDSTGFSLYKDPYMPDLQSYFVFNFGFNF